MRLLYDAPSRAKRRLQSSIGFMLLTRALRLIMLCLLTTAAFGGAISLNGKCIIGNCQSPDVIPIGGLLRLRYTVFLHYDNGDEYQIQGFLSGANTDGTDISTAGTYLTATYLGSGSKPLKLIPSGADSMTLDLFANFAWTGGNTINWNISVYGAFAGSFGPTGTSLTSQQILAGETLPLFGPYSPPGLFSGSQSNLVVAGVTDPVLLDRRINISFAAGSQPGATVILTNEPIFQSQPTISQGGIVPIFGSRNTVQPGSWASIYGTNLSGVPVQWNGNFPTQLGGVTVTVNSKPAYLWYVSPTQINFQVPDDTTIGPVDLVVTTLGGAAISSVKLAPYAPSLSLFDSKYPVALVLTPGSPGNSGAGYDLIGPANAFSFSTRPVKAGETLILYGVGLGPTTPAVPSGQLVTTPAASVTLPQVTIGGVATTVTYAGIVEAGLYQINLIVPSAGTGDQPIQVSVGEVSAQSGLLVTLQ